MKIKKFAYDDIPFLSSKDLSYINLDSNLSSFYEHKPQISSFLPAIELKETQDFNRKLLVDVIQQQYADIETSSAVENNIDQLLHSNTYTVITAHQPCLFTGPLYFIYKIASVLHLTNRLNQELDDYRIVPMFVMGGEDHDFEEMNHLRIDDQTVTWTREDSGGPVGRMDNKGLSTVIDEITALLPPSDHAKEILGQIRDYFNSDNSYGQAMIRLVNLLFQEYGLVILNMDAPALKHEFKDIMKDDIQNHSSYKLVSRSQEELLSHGIEEQAFVREINLFYIQHNLRTRIEAVEGQYQVGDELIPEDELFKRLEDHPGDFSPNVILRPLYQEKIIPNLAYIGGGGEIAYWLERKAQFEHYNLPFPILIRRNSAAYFDKKHQRLLQKSNLELEHLFVEDIEYFISNWVKENYDASLESYKSNILQTLAEVQSKAKTIDSTLGPYVGARSREVEKVIEQIEGKLIKASKERGEITTNRIRRIYELLFPNLSLQERKINFLGIYAVWGPEFIQFLVNHLDPLDRQFYILYE